MLLILASGSAARQAMLRNAGVKCFSVPSDVDEAAMKQVFTGAPEDLALALATAKAARVAASYPDATVIGADQLLVCEGQYFNKPTTEAEAAAQLAALSGRAHTLITAVCVYQNHIPAWTDISMARLQMRALSPDYIARYLREEGEGIYACAGAYQLEGRGAQLFESIEGDFFTILGLNLLPLLGFLRRAAVLPA